MLYPFVIILSVSNVTWFMFQMNKWTRTCHVSCNARLRGSHQCPYRYARHLCTLSSWPFRVLAREIYIIKTKLKMIGSVSFSDTRWMQVIIVHAGRYFSRRNTFTIVWKHECFPGINFLAISCRHHPPFITNFVIGTPFHFILM